MRSDFTNIRSDFTNIFSDHFKSQERLHTMLTLQLQIITRQTPPQKGSVSDIYIFNTTGVNIGLNSLKVRTDVPSYIDPRTSNLQMYTRFVTYHSCDLELDITMLTSYKNLISLDLAPFLSAHIDLGSVIIWVFSEPLLLGSYCHYSEKTDENKNCVVNRGYKLQGILSIYCPDTYLYYILLHWQHMRNEKSTIQCSYIG